MNFLNLIGMECRKLRRSKILWILLIPVLLVWIMAVKNADLNFNMEFHGLQPENNFFIQSFLSASWFMIPACLVVITVLITQNERTNQGIQKMLTLPVDTVRLCLAKFCVLLLLLIVEVLMMSVAYIPAAALASSIWDYPFMLELSYVFRICTLLLLVTLPMAACYWLLSVILTNPVFSVGIGLALIVPTVLAINTKIWFLYPMCYPMMLITSQMHKLSENMGTFPMDLVPWLPVAVGITVLSLIISCICYGKAERR